MQRALASGLVVFALASVGRFAAAQPNRPDIPPDLATLTQRMAPKILDRLAERDGGLNGLTIAVFPFGDARGAIPPGMFEVPTEIQGELIYRLREKSEGRFRVLSLKELAEAFRDKGEAVIDPERPEETARTLKGRGIDVAVVGSISVASARVAQVSLAAARRDRANLEVIATLISRDGVVARLKDALAPDGIDGTPEPPSGRFAVEVVVDGEGLPMKRHSDPDGDFHNVYFLSLPPELKGREYTIRLINRGTPPVVGNRDDRDRLFAVAVLVDGVNSIYQDQGDGRVGPISVAPRNARKWVLAGPGREVVRTDDGAGFRTIGVDGPGHSVVPIPGFQTDDRRAITFVFTDPAESIAQTVRETSGIGLISAFFYAQSLPNDPTRFQASGAGAGTKGGRQIHHDTQRIKLPLQEDPVEVVRIFYQYSGERRPGLPVIADVGGGARRRPRPARRDE